MPLAALIEDKILCVHGGIGITIRTIDEIELIQRPLEISHDPKTVLIPISILVLTKNSFGITLVRSGAV